MRVCLSSLIDLVSYALAGGRYPRPAALRLRDCVINDAEAALRIAVIGDTSLRTTSLGLGCAGLFSLPSKRDRVELVRQALDHGILHFDVAPMYGLGVAESELGAALGRDRDRVTIATKFGIAPRAWVRTLARVQAPARAVIARSKGLNSGLRAQASGPGVGAAGSLLYRSTGYTGPEATQNIAASLRRLKVDYIDLILLHDPPPHSDLNGVCEALARAQERGDVGAWGVAGEVAPTKSVIDRIGCPVPVLQLPWNCLEPAEVPELGSAGLVTFGAIGRALPVLEKALADDAALAHEWAAALGVSSISRETLAAVLLADAIDRNKDGITLFSTRSSAHLAAAVTHASDVELTAVLPAFRQLLGRLPKAPVM